MTTYLRHAIAACEQALNSEPSDLIQACQTLGNVLQSMGRFEESIVWHSRAYQAQSNPAALYNDLGSLYAQQQHWQQAIAAYTRAVTVNPNFARAYWQLADLFSQLGQSTAALDKWFQALTLEPHQATADAHCDLGNFFVKGGELNRAAICYQRALQLNSQLSEAYHNLGEVLVNLERWDEAIACYQEATAQDPNPAWAYHKLGDALFAQQRWDEAAIAYDHAIQINPDFAWSYHNLAEVLLRQEQWDKTIAVARAAIALGQEHPWAYTQLGRAQIMVGLEEEAIACHQRACFLRGWHQCHDRDYQFTQDWFSHNIPYWQEHLADIAHQPQIQVLEIGSFQGMSACWLLDHILTHPSAQLTCLDPNFQVQFSANILKTQALEKVVQLVGLSQDYLPTLPLTTYDVIYIDGCHLADYVYQDALLSWKLLKSNGLLIFDDYQWSDPNYPDQDPKLGIDRFISEFNYELELIHRHYQVFVRKRTSIS